MADEVIGYTKLSWVLLMGMRVVFAGTSAFAVSTLAALLSSPHQLLAVCTSPDRRAGRGRQLSASPVKIYAQARDVPMLQPTQWDKTVLEKLVPDVMVVVAYGMLLPKEVLVQPTFGCVNLHPSLLPRWRGAAPIQHALLNGEEMTGLTVIQMEVGMDSGPILLQQRHVILSTENSDNLQQRLSKAGADLMMAVLEIIEVGRQLPVAQDPSQVCYAPKITKAQGRIDWQRPAVDICNQVRAFNPWPVAFTYFQGKCLRVWSARLVTNLACDGVPPGGIVKAGKTDIFVATAKGVLQLLSVQLPGGRRLPAGDFFNAHKKALLSQSGPFFNTGYVK